MKSIIILILPLLVLGQACQCEGMLIRSGGDGTVEIFNNTQVLDYFNPLLMHIELKGVEPIDTRTEWYAEIDSVYSDHAYFNGSHFDEPIWLVGTLFYTSGDYIGPPDYGGGLARDLTFCAAEIELHMSNESNEDQVYHIFASVPVPIPSTILLLGSGLFWLVALRRKFKG